MVLNFMLKLAGRYIQVNVVRLTRRALEAAAGNLPPPAGCLAAGVVHWRRKYVLEMYVFV
jgi:hypothetical protein